MNEKPPYYMIWLLIVFLIVTAIVLLFAMGKASSIVNIPFVETEVRSGQTN